jgi:hypothetical protein
VTSDDKNLWRERWLSSVNQLTSLNLQKKSWLDTAQTNPHWSFVEFMSCYFDDIGIDENYKYPIEREWLSKKEFEIIISWHEELDKYNSPKNDPYDHLAILEDPKWFEILQTGLTMKSRLASILNETEKKILTEEMNYLNFV